MHFTCKKSAPPPSPAKADLLLVPPEDTPFAPTVRADFGISWCLFLMEGCGGNGDDSGSFGIFPLHSGKCLSAGNMYTTRRYVEGLKSLAQKHISKIEGQSLTKRREWGGRTSNENLEVFWKLQMFERPKDTVQGPHSVSMLFL